MEDQEKLTGIAVLKHPIQPDELEWRVSTVRYDDPKAKKGPNRLTLVAYINNRCVQNRFDDAFGWNGWSCTFREVKDGFICQIKIEGETGFVIKEDGANRTNVEPVKGGISDSMKRCAVQFGLGRGLYDYPNVYVHTTSKWIPNWVKPRLEGMVDAINAGKFTQDFVNLKEQS